MGSIRESSLSMVNLTTGHSKDPFKGITSFIIKSLVNTFIKGFDLIHPRLHDFTQFLVINIKSAVAILFQLIAM